MAFNYYCAGERRLTIMIAVNRTTGTNVYHIAALQHRRSHITAERLKIASLAQTADVFSILHPS